VDFIEGNHFTMMREPKVSHPYLSLTHRQMLTF
jgi:hypothetical protein